MKPSLISTDASVILFLRSKVKNFMNKVLRYGELFCGPGGLALGAVRGGARVTINKLAPKKFPEKLLRDSTGREERS